MRKYYPGITIFKLAGSLLVLVAHLMLIKYMALMPGQAVIQFTSLATRVVVPCFYVVSGFLAYKSWSHAADPRLYMQKYFKRIAIIYCFFCVIFIAQSIVPKLISEGLSAGNLVLQAKILFMAIVLNGPFIQFWFIPPLVFGLITAYWLFQKQYVRLAVILALTGFMGIQFVSGSLKTVLGVTANSFPPIDPAYLDYLNLFATRYIGFGFTFVTAGVLLAKFEDKLMQIKVKPILIFSVILTFAETLLLLLFSEWTTEYKLTFSVLPNTLLIFYGILRIRSEAVHKYNKVISLFSMVTFFGHILFMVANLWLLGWRIERMNTGQDLTLLLLTLLECVAATAFLRMFANTLSARKTRSAAL
ncbi:acyltransferase family protein [Paenibacillus sp. LPE1-1-1.1]|uniref:acyltransferase family protein n=1 Tax=Paenibacillus sp. LPE1-1-1.1 TaxID=3135230 RepID=UPI0034348C6E